MRLVAVDPGKNLGFAAFQNGFLLDCGLFVCEDTRELTKNLFHSCDVVKPDQAVIELPRVFPQKSWKGDPNDLIQVAKIAGIAIAALSPFCDVDEIYPQEWKGNRPKDVDNKHTISLLKDFELDIYNALHVPKNLRHNVIDAIGIGLWRLKRR